MKSMFLVFILTTSFSPLILTSDSDPRGTAAAEKQSPKSQLQGYQAMVSFILSCDLNPSTAAAVAVATTEKQDEEIMFCPKCKSRGYEEICHFCKEKLISKKVLLEAIEIREREIRAAVEREIRVTLPIAIRVIDMWQNKQDTEKRAAQRAAEERSWPLHENCCCKIFCCILGRCL
jgi:hypothetical protein